jgi:hypothetical protein
LDFNAGTESRTSLKVLFRRSSRIRNAVVNERAWLHLFVILIVWHSARSITVSNGIGVTVITGDSAESFLGTQGYVGYAVGQGYGTGKRVWR